MKKHIAEDLPARKHPQAQLSTQNKKPEGRDSGKNDGKGAEKTPEERVRQAVYDIRYRARRENLPLRSAYSQYMQNSSMAESEKAEVRAKLFGKGGMQAEHFAIDMKETASTAMAKALYKVFVDKTPEIIDEEKLKEALEKRSSISTDKKYKVRVTDKESGVTYTRFATRDKISQLRSKGLEVEMTEYGTPYEGERTKGEKTSEVLSKKKKPNDRNLANNYPPYDKVTRGDVVAGRLGKDQMGGKNVKEDFIGEVSRMANLPQTDSPAVANPNKNLEQIDFLPANKKNKVVVNPTNTVLAHTEYSGETISETGYSKFLEMLQEKKMTKKQKTKEKKLKGKYDSSDMKANMEKQYGSEKGKKVYFATIRKQAMKEESDCENEDKMNIKKDQDPDPRSLQTAVSLAKLGARYRGIKNPIPMIASNK